MALRIVYQAAAGRFEEAMADIYRPISEAGTEAIREVADTVKADGRAEIARAGFSKKWQNTLRVDVHPKRGVSANAAVFIWHKIHYAGVFEEGATIKGNPTLWVPFSNIPKRLARKRVTPKHFAQEIGPLVKITRPGKPDLLAARLHLSRVNARRDVPKISARMLRRGPDRPGVTRTVPIFFGLRRIDIEKRFSIGSVTERAAARLPELYLKHFQDD